MGDLIFFPGDAAPMQRETRCDKDELLRMADAAVFALKRENLALRGFYGAVFSGLIDATLAYLGAAKESEAAGLRAFHDEMMKGFSKANDVHEDMLEKTENWVRPPSAAQSD
jgi:hypothetical protein